VLHWAEVLLAFAAVVAFVVWGAVKLDRYEDELEEDLEDETVREW
jgi:hypothetical protein